MRRLSKRAALGAAIVGAFVGLVAPCAVHAQEFPDEALNEMNSASLTADDRAQISLGGFRQYLQRIEASDPSLYGLLDPRLRDLEARELGADVVFWTATGLALAATGAAIPVYTEVGHDEGIALFIAAGSTFVLGLIIQAILRPQHNDLMVLIDLHDERVGRR